MQKNEKDTKKMEYPFVVTFFYYFCHVNQV